MKSYEYQRNYELDQNYWWFVGVRSMVDTLLALSVSNKKNLGKVLDVGCGTGALLDKLKDRSEELWGLDVSEEALNFCRMRGHKNLVLADATKTGLLSDYFDVITAIGVIEHIKDDKAFINEMRRILKPGGVIIILTSSFPFLWSIHDVANEHIKRYYLREFKSEMGEGGFSTIRISHMNFFLFLPIATVLLLHRLVFGTNSKKPERILPKVPSLVNFFLILILKIESRLMYWITLPWGISMIGVFRKKLSEKSLS